MCAFLERSEQCVFDAEGSLRYKVLKFIGDRPSIKLFRRRLQAVFYCNMFLSNSRIVKYSQKCSQKGTTAKRLSLAPWGAPTGHLRVGAPIWQPTGHLCIGAGQVLPRCHQSRRCWLSNRALQRSLYSRNTCNVIIMDYSTSQRPPTHSWSSSASPAASRPAPPRLGWRPPFLAAGACAA